MKKIFLEVVLWTWCLPQSLLGGLIYLFFKNRVLKRRYCHNIVISYVDTKSFGGVSLGKFIFIGRYYFSKRRKFKHEFGHTIQSYIFGPLYLLIIGLPSVFMFWISKFDKKFKRRYFKHFPEDEADDFGGVKRK